MKDPGRKRKKKGPKKEKEFLDVAPEAFVRYLALDIWRRVEAVRREGDETEGRDRGLQAIIAFDERYPYEEVWRKEWQHRVEGRVWSAEPGELLGLIEGMVAAALEAEEAERKGRGDGSLYDEEDYLAFVDDQLKYLFQHRDDEFLAR
jgi:hypothetical protein